MLTATLEVLLRHDGDVDNRDAANHLVLSDFLSVFTVSAPSVERLSFGFTVSASNLVS